MGVPSSRGTWALRVGLALAAALLFPARERSLSAAAGEVRFVRYFAEGANNAFFRTEFALFNPWADRTAWIRLQFFRADGAVYERSTSLAPRGVVSIRAEDVPGLEVAEFATRVESDTEVTSERTMTWGSPTRGAHAESSAAATSPTWYFAEGLTCCGADTFLLLFNPHTVPLDVWVSYHTPSTPPIVVAHQLGSARRSTIWVNYEDPRLVGQPVAMVVSTTCPATLTCSNAGSGLPFVAERALYWSPLGMPFEAGQVSMGAIAPATYWTLAEGATTAFDSFLLLANFGPQPVSVLARFNIGPPSSATLLERTYVVPAGERRTVWLNHDDPALAASEFSTVLRSEGAGAFVAERSQWWPRGESTQWRATHGGRAMTVDGRARRWALAGGRLLDPVEQAFLVVSGPPGVSNQLAPFTVAVTLSTEGGVVRTRTFPLAGGAKSRGARLTLDIAQAFPEAVGRRFGLVVESSLATTKIGYAELPLSVELATYHGLGGGSAPYDDVLAGTDISGPWVQLNDSGVPVTTAVQAGQPVTFENTEPLTEATVGPDPLAAVMCAELAALPVLRDGQRATTPPFLEVKDCAYVVTGVGSTPLRGTLVVR